MVCNHGESSFLVLARACSLFAAGCKLDLEIVTRFN